MQIMLLGMFTSSHSVLSCSVSREHGDFNKSPSLFEKDPSFRNDLQTYSSLIICRFSQCGLGGGLSPAESEAAPLPCRFQKPRCARLRRAAVFMPDCSRSSSRMIVSSSSVNKLQLLHPNWTGKLRGGQSPFHMTLSSSLKSSICFLQTLGSECASLAHPTGGDLECGLESTTALPDYHT